MLSGLALVINACSATTSPAARQTITLSEWKVDVAATTLRAGQATFTIVNAGTMAHELLVFRSDLEPSAYPTDSAGIKEDDPAITKVSDGDSIAPGSSLSRTVDLTSPGKYMFVCNLPGHFKLGMHTLVTVTS